MLVILESPLAGNIERNLKYLDLCIRDSVFKGEAPFATHKMYVGPLSDHEPHERILGMDAGQQWYQHAKRCVVYTDWGISPGMEKGIELCQRLGMTVEFRSIL